MAVRGRASGPAARLDELYAREGEQAHRHPHGRGVRRGDARMAAQRRRRARSAATPRTGCRPHRPGHAAHPRARDGPPRALHGVPRLGRFGGALHRAVRHGLGHHEQLRRRSPTSRTPTSPWSRPASPRRCSRPRSAWSRPSRRCIAYNKLEHRPRRASATRLESFADEFAAILSRQTEVDGQRRGRPWRRSAAAQGRPGK